MMIPTSAAAYLRNEFITSFVTDANPGNWDPANDKGAFAITLLTLIYWDAAAKLAGAGNAKSADIIKFMADHLSRASTPFGGRYAQRAAIIYWIFRNGLVHQRFPGPIQGSKGTVTWALGRDLPSQHHVALYGPLQPNRSHDVCGITLTGALFLGPPRSYLMINPDLMYEHTVQSFEHFATSCERDRELTKAVQRGVAAAKSPRARNKLVDAALGSPDPWP